MPTYPADMEKRRKQCSNASLDNYYASVCTSDLVQERVDSGEIGEMGDSGEMGEMGDSGEMGEMVDSGEMGEMGDSGEMGEMGDSGEMGERGDSGEMGERGDSGEMGERGDSGEIGEMGDSGEMGERGDLTAGTSEILETQLTRSDSRHLVAAIVETTPTDTPTNTPSLSSLQEAILSSLEAIQSMELGGVSSDRRRRHTQSQKRPVGKFPAEVVPLQTPFSPHLPIAPDCTYTHTHTHTHTHNTILYFSTYCRSSTQLNCEGENWLCPSARPSLSHSAVCHRETPALLT